MECSPSINLNVKLKFTDSGKPPALEAFAFTQSGRLLQTSNLEKNKATLELPADYEGRKIQIAIAPQTEKGQARPTLENLKRNGGLVRSYRLLTQKPLLELEVPTLVFANWCLCLVRGKLVKRVSLPDGSVEEQPVCNARVHICEVDRLRILIPRLPELELFKLRDELLKIHPWPPLPPHRGPVPDPVPEFDQARMQLRSSLTTNSVRAISNQQQLVSNQQQFMLSTVASTNSLEVLKDTLVNLAELIQYYICDFLFLWPFYRKDCLTTIEVDDEGNFSSLIGFDCYDQPDIYLWVEQFQEGEWRTVYKPSLGCGTRWNYQCGDEIVLNLPNAEACDEPNYDIPAGVTLFVLPYAIGHSPIFGNPDGTATAPTGWVRSDGMIDYNGGSSLGTLFSAPFGSTLRFIQDDSYFIPSTGIKFYRYSYRRLGDSDWTPIVRNLARGYRMEYSDRLPTYESYPVGPESHGGESGLFQFKPVTPPDRPDDPSTVVAREWTQGNLGESAAVWDTTLAAPAISDSNVDDDAGTFEIKIEVFDPDGNRVAPGAGTFEFLVRNTDGTTTRTSAAGEVQDDSYVFQVHVDNNNVSSALPQPSIDGIAASDDCGFLRYDAGDQVHVSYHASHPNNHAVFQFGIKRGSNNLPNSQTLSPYVEVSAASAPTIATPYVKSGGDYQRDFTVNELVGSCVNAAFASHLNVFGKATNGYQRLGIHSSELIAFALAEQQP